MTSRADAVATTRAMMLAAARDLFLAQAFEDVTLAAIAEAAGVSHQTVLNHFESKEGVAVAVAEALQADKLTTRTPARLGDPLAAVRALVGDYEVTGDADVRWASSAERLGGLAPLLDEARAFHQAWLGEVFAGQLPRTPAARRRALLALHAATDACTWKLLQRDLRLERAEVERIMADLVAGALERGTR